MINIVVADRKGRMNGKGKEDNEYKTKGPKREGEEAAMDVIGYRISEE